MKWFYYLPAVLAASLPAISAAAETPTHAFECDTPAGHFSYWHRSVTAPAIEIAGRITVNDMLKDKKWSPLASVVLRSGQNRFGIRFYGVMKTPDMVFLELLKVGGRDRIGLLGFIPRTQEPVPFTLRLEASGLLKVTVADSEASTQLGEFKPESLELSCSTGDFEFTGVTVEEKSPT